MSENLAPLTKCTYTLNLPAVKPGLDIIFQCYLLIFHVGVVQRDSPQVVYYHGVGVRENDSND